MTQKNTVIEQLQKLRKELDKLLIILSKIMTPVVIKVEINERLYEEINERLYEEIIVIAKEFIKWRRTHDMTAIKAALSISRALVFVRKQWQQFIFKNSHSRYLFKRLLVRYLPEEYRGEFNALRRRWYQQKNPEWRIHLKTFFCVLNLLRIQLQCRIQNLWTSLSTTKN